MKVQAKFFASFRDLFGGRAREVEVPAERTVRDVLDLLCDTPARRAAIFEGGGLKPDLIVLVNGAPVGSPAGLRTPLAEGDTVAVFPMLGGG
jgi:MoaD family protein